MTFSKPGTAKKVDGVRNPVTLAKLSEAGWVADEKAEAEKAQRAPRAAKSDK